MKITNGTYLFGESDLPYSVCFPEGNPKGIVQLVHGVCESFEKYLHDGTAETLCGAGYIVCCVELPGHGARAENGNRGDFADYRQLGDEILSLQPEMRRKYRFLPFFYLTQGLGALLISDKLLDGFSDSSGVLMLGPYAGDGAFPAERFFAGVLSVFGGSKPSAFLRGMIGKRFSAAIGKTGTDDWLCSSVPSEGEFPLSARAYREIFRLIRQLSKEERIDTLPHSVPLLLLSGERDAFGGCGDSVRMLYDRLFEAGVDDLQLKLFENARHRLLSEPCREEVLGTVLEWLDTECRNRVLVNTWR